VIDVLWRRTACKICPTVQVSTSHTGCVFIDTGSWISAVRDLLVGIITRRFQTSDATPRHLTLLLPAGPASYRVHVPCHSCSQCAVLALHMRFKCHL
jgi:hypothetical protein